MATRGKKLTPQQEAQIVRRYTAGESIYPIAEGVGCSPQTVSVVLKRQGVESRTRGGRERRELTTRERQTVVRRYENGDFAKDIAADLHTSLSKVYDAIREVGLPLRGVGQQPWKPTKKELAQLFELYNSGMRVYGISRKMGHGGDTIERVMREHGIEPDKGPLKGPASPVWKGGRSLNGKYVQVYVAPDDPMASMCMAGYPYAMEHRLVMARSLGRTLTSDESVHHINGDPQDNRLENLQLRHRYHGKGHSLACGECGSRNIVEVPL